MKVIRLTIAISTILACFYRAEAQQRPNAIPRLGFVVSTGTPATPSPLLDAFRLGLQNLGYSEGKNILIERRFAEGNLGRMPALVNDLVQQEVDIIVAVNNVVIRAAKEATKTIPIVMISSVDPVEAGYVQSFAHPGGNITGLAWLNREISAKRLELVKEMLPNTSKVAVLWDANGPGPAVAIKEYAAAARAFKWELLSLAVRGPKPEFAKAFQIATTARAGALVVVGNPFIAKHAKQVFEFATNNDLPTMTERSTYVAAGGLMSYGANFADLHRRAAEYVVDILKGAKPADLPVRLASRFEIFINLKTAKKLGLVIPRSILLQADKVIQ